MFEQNTHSPFFTIITPVYNRESCVSNAIESIKRNTFDDWEHIIVNDGSVDKTASIIDEASKRDFRIKTIHLPHNQGVSAARNAGIKAAKGKYLLFLDSDDELRQDALTLLYGIIEAENNIDAIIFQGSRITTVSPERASKKQSLQLFSYQEIRNCIVAGILGIHSYQPDHMYRHVLCNKCIKTSIFNDNSILFDINKRTWEDEEVCIKVFDKCNNLIVLDQPLVIERTFETSDHLSMSYYSDGAKNVLSQYKWMLNTFGNEFDFYNDFALDFHFNRIQTWIWRTMSKDKNRKDIVLEVLKDSDFSKLLKKRSPNGIFEKAVRFFVTHKMYGLGYMVYLSQNTINRGQTF